MKTFLSFLITVLATVTQAQVIVVSDIDDTIKVSHVLDPDSAVGNSVKVRNLFRGMPQLYQEILSQNPNTPFYYLSNAPKLLRPLHAEFLSLNQFPDGALLLRRSLRDHTHKITSLRAIISAQKPQVLILFGDNGEKDPLVYEQIKMEFPQLRMITFIREAYSSQHDEDDDRGMRLFPGQIGFVSPLDIALRLQAEGLLPEASVRAIEESYVPETMAAAADEDDDGETGTLSFPNWQDCRDFQVPDLLRKRETSLAEALVRRIEYRCSIPPFDD